MTFRVWFLAFLPLLFACGRYYAGGQPVRPPVEPVTPPAIEGKRTTLTVFGAGFCSKCKTQFPELSQSISTMSAAEKKILDVKMYLVAGEPSNVHPTQDLADQYKDAHFTVANSFPDLPWRWANFKINMPGARLEVPAAVVSDENGQIIKRFPAGETSFVPAEIFAFIQSRIMAH